MIITCEECQARFRLADEKLKSGGTKVRCSKCRHVFTVMPPEPEPTEEVVDFGAFNMEAVTEEEPVPVVPAAPPEPSLQEVAPATAGNDYDIDFNGLEQSMGPESGTGDLVEEFSFADTSTPAEAHPGTEATPAAPASARGELNLGGDEAPREFDFDATFAETGEEPTVPPVAGPAELAFNQELSVPTEVGAPASSATFSFEAELEIPASTEFQLEAEPVALGAGEFDFEAESTLPATEEFNLGAEPAAGLSEFSFETEAGEKSLAFGEAPVTAESAESFEFGSGESFESSAFNQESAFGEEVAAWDQPAKSAGTSFDFDEPSFETKTETPAPKSGDDTSLGFGEIDFSDESGKTGEFASAPSFGAEPDFSQAKMSRPAEPPPPPPPPAPSRARSEAPLPTPPMPRKSPMARVVLLLVVLLLALCGTGGYFYFMGDGQRIVDNLLMKIKGEQPVVPVEQRIGLKIAGSSYVDNRATGQLLVIQGSATNNFAGSRSAITVKGLLLDAGGKILQQQTVFCGNYLSEEKLRAMKYAQIEEAMNNQFGDSLANMNVKPGVELRFTIVFHNLPKEMANINVEVVDSKAGGL